jgi:hypothetical protein
MKNLEVKVQGVRGGTPQFLRVGYVNIFMCHPEDFVLVDSFEGQGDTYQRREQVLVKIVGNGEILFEGTKQELFEKLKSQK